MARDDVGPDFIESLARGLGVIRSFGHRYEPRALREIAEATGLARPTTRRIVLTLERLGYVRQVPDGYVLTPKVLELGVSYTLSARLWQLAEPHLRTLALTTSQAASIAQLDGPDILYVARVAVPKTIAVNIHVGTRFPAASTALGKVLLAQLPAERLDAALDAPSSASVVAHRTKGREELVAELREVRARGWSSTDGEVVAGVRSVAVPLHDGDGSVLAAVNVTAIAAEVSAAVLVDEFLPLLVRTAGEIEHDLRAIHDAPQRVVTVEH